MHAHLMGACCDKPAQSLIQYTTEPNGLFRCGQCEIKGYICYGNDIQDLKGQVYYSSNYFNLPVNMNCYNLLINLMNSNYLKQEDMFV